MQKGFFRPNLRVLILTITISVLFWFFPIFSKSIFAIPFINFSSVVIFFISNIFIAYIFSLFLVKFSKLSQRILLILLFIVIYISVPKISSYWVGDLGGSTDTYCDCYGITWETSSCCYSTVNYCVGICQRNETTKTWLKGP